MFVGFLSIFCGVIGLLRLALFYARSTGNQSLLIKKF